MTKRVNLTEIIDYTALACQQPRPVTNSACQVMLEHISEHLSRGNTVSLHGFGTFKAVDGAVQFTPSKKIMERETPDDLGWPFSPWTTAKAAG